MTLDTDAGTSGQGEGSGGTDLFRKGFADLAIGADSFMAGKIREKMFADTYGREPSTRGWAATSVISAMARYDSGVCHGRLLREGKGIPELIAEVRGYVDQGFDAIKLKAGGISGGSSVEDDYQRVKAVREAAGPNVKLMLDAKQGWDVPTAIRASNRMHDLDIVWLKEPLHWYDDVEPLKQLKLNTRIPPASGEHELTRWGARSRRNHRVRKAAGMAAMSFIKMAPHHEPVLHGHLLASIPNGYILESFADGDPFWFEIYDRETAQRKKHTVPRQYAGLRHRIQSESAPLPHGRGSVRILKSKAGDSPGDCPKRLRTAGNAEANPCF